MSLGHPDPQEDPTPGLVTDPPNISTQLNEDGTVTVTFEGTLEAASNVKGPWVPIDAESPLTFTPDEPMQFDRAVR